MGFLLWQDPVGIKNSEGVRILSNLLICTEFSLFHNNKFTIIMKYCVGSVRSPNQLKCLHFLRTNGAISPIYINIHNILRRVCETANNTNFLY